MMHPRILLAEDDAVSAAFLAASAEALPATVDIAGSLAEALALATSNEYALWLFDAHLPDGSGSELLARLRMQGLQVPALAHTASQERHALDALIAAGYAQVLVKPLSATALQSAIRCALGMDKAEPASAVDVPRGDKTPVWDDDAAIAALNGNRGHVHALRQLCLDELPQARRDVLGAVQTGDVDALRGILHRLSASCGFVGAARLAAAVRALREIPDSVEAMAQFEAAVQDTLSSR